MQNFAELHLEPVTLARYGLPDIPYPFPVADLKSAVLDGGDLPLAMMLHGLQQLSRDGEAHWQQMEPAMDRLAELLAPDDTREVISAAGNHWWLEVGHLDLGGKLITIQRGDALIAAITARDDGWDGSDVPEWRKQLDLVARPAARVVAELGVYDTLSGNEDDEPVANSNATEEFETPAPAAWRSKRQQTRTVQGRFLGCLLGGAVGDALGAPVELMKRAEILRRFGPKGITQYAPAYGGLGTITDDTQMTLFTAEGLIRGWVRSCFKGITTYSGVTAHAYLRWLQTQGERPTCDIEFGSNQSGWLFQQRQLHSRRAPGNTCLSALRAMSSLGEPARNDSKGCGGAMRVAPVGLFAWRLRQSGSGEPRWRFRLDRIDRRQPAGRDARREGNPRGVAGVTGAARRHHRIGGRPLRIQGLGDRRVQQQRRAEPADLAQVPRRLRGSEQA